MTASTTRSDLRATATFRPRTVADFGHPRLRGWLHAYAAVLALVCGGVLVTLAAAQPGMAPLISTAVYSVTVCLLFGVSAVFHRRAWSERGYQVMRRLDHAAIFTFIAGTYTPLCALLLPSGKATWLLTLVWAAALGGAVAAVVWPRSPRWMSASLYLGLGWAAVMILPDVLRAAGVSALALLAGGGILYSVGAVLYAVRKPNPWPATFGHHEFFHAFTLAAAICHHVAIYFALFA